MFLSEKRSGNHVTLVYSFGWLSRSFPWVNQGQTPKKEMTAHLQDLTLAGPFSKSPQPIVAKEQKGSTKK